MDHEPAEVLPAPRAIEYASPGAGRPVSGSAKVIEISGLLINVASAAYLMLATLLQARRWASIHFSLGGCGTGRWEPLENVGCLVWLLPVCFIGGCAAAFNPTFVRICRLAFLAAVGTWALTLVWMHGYLRWLLR